MRYVRWGYLRCGIFIRRGFLPTVTCRPSGRVLSEHCRRIQPVDATIWLNRSAGVSQARHTVIYLRARDVGLVVLMLALIVIAVAFYPRVRGWIGHLSRWCSTMRKRHTEGELAAWCALRSAAQSGSMQRIVPAIYRWMDASPRFERPARVAMIDDRQLKPLADAVQHHYGPGSTEILGVRLHINRIWTRVRKQKHIDLPPLNER